MKKTTLCIVLLLVSMQSSAGLAQDRKFEYTFGGGISLLLTPNKVKDFYKTGFQGVVGFGFRIMSNLLIGGSVSYNNFGLDKTALLESVGIPSDSNIDVVGGTITLVEMLGVVKYYFWASEKSPNFYVLGGPGFSWGRISEVSVLIPNQGPFTQNSQTDTNFTLAGGLGVKFRVGKSTNLFIEGRYSVLISDGEDLTYVPLKFGVLF